MSADTFPYDVFLSHRSKDKAVMRPLAERLPACRAEAARRRRKDGRKVWPVPLQPPGSGGSDRWGLKPGDSNPAKAYALHVSPGLRVVLGAVGGLPYTMTTRHIRQEAAGKKRHEVRLTVNCPGVTDLKAEATFTLT